jgi:hypothetical protein
MARGDHWWSEPPLWAWITMVAGLVTIVVLLPIALNRAAPATREGAAAGATATTDADTTAAAPNPTADTTRVLVVGDSYTAGFPEGGSG